MGIENYNSSASLNTAISGIAIGEGAPRANMNDAIRQLMADIAQGFLQSGTGAVARTLPSKMRETVSVKDFGAVGDGTNDDTLAIQAAINYLQNGSGGRLVFPVGTYYITATLTLGNATGSGSPNNTLAPVSLEGLGAVSGVGYASPSNCAIIKSNVAGPAIKFAANIGWGLKGFAFTFTTTSTAAMAYQMYEVSSGNADDITVLNCPGLVHIDLETWGVNNLTLNHFRNHYIYMNTSPANAVALKLSGTGAGSDVALNTFAGIHVQPGAATHVGVLLGYADTNTFIRYDFNPRAGVLAAAAAVKFDYSVNTSFPNQNVFLGGSSYLTPITSTGTPTLAAGAENRWIGFDYANNAPVPSALGFTVEKVKLAANRTFYVNTSTGSATSFGIYSGNPCQTLQQAYDQIAKYFDLNGFTATISIANGTYSAGVNAVQPVTGGRCIFVGGGGGTVFSGAGTPFIANAGTDIEVQSVNLSPASGDCVAADGGLLRIGTGVIFGTTPGSHAVADNGGIVRATAAYYINGGSIAHFRARHGGKIVSSVAATLLASVSITNFAETKECGVINAVGASYSLGAFTVTGTRYNAVLNGVIDTNGGGANFFPGTIAGTTATGGQYA
jgi:hypothetical protein